MQTVEKVLKTTKNFTVHRPMYNAWVGLILLIVYWTAGPSPGYYTAWLCLGLINLSVLIRILTKIYLTLTTDGEGEFGIGTVHECLSVIGHFIFRLNPKAFQKKVGKGPKQSRPTS